MRTSALLALALGCLVGLAVGFGQNPHTADSREAPGHRTSAIAGEELNARVREILTDREPLRRFHDLGELLATLGPDAAPALVDAFDASSLSGGDPEFVLLGSWWAAFDPEAANRWSLRDPSAQFGSVSAAIFRVWAHSDPETAAARAGGLPSPALAGIAKDAAITGWDESGKPGLEATLQKLGAAEQQRLGEILARRRVVTLGPEGAFRWAEALDGSQFREMMLVRVASASASVKNGPAFATKWAAPRIQSGDRISGLPRRIGTRWITHDPEGAMAWLATLPEGADRDDGVTESFRDWVQRDPARASAWIEKTQLQRWSEPAYAIYARAIAAQRPREAIELAQRLSAGPLRDDTTIVVGRIWTEIDPKAADAWLKNSGLSKEMQQHAKLVARRPRIERMKREEEARRAAEAAGVPRAN